MSKTLKIMVIGCGGNGSFLLRHLHRLIKKDQLPANAEFVLYDNDTVEKKNLLYQDFEIKDVLDNKAEVMAARYDMVAKNKRVKDSKEFDPFDIVIVAVDNPDLRELLYRYMDKHPEKYWIDVRAEGRAVSIYTKHRNNTLAKLLETLPKSSEGVSTSCQLAYELDNGIIQMGNQIAAVIAAQLLLNHLRGEENSDEFTHMF